MSTNTYTEARERAKALAMATGVQHTVVRCHRTGRAIAAKSKKVEPTWVDRELQGSTAEDRRQGNEWDDAMGDVYNTEAALDRQLDRDAKWFAGWYTEEHVAKLQSRSRAVAIAKRHNGRVRTVKTKVTVGYHRPGYGMATWVVERTHYEVSYTTRVCYACPGDVDYVEPAFEPGLLWCQAYDVTAEEAIAE